MRTAHSSSAGSTSSGPPTLRRPGLVGFLVGLVLVVLFIALLFPWDALGRRIIWEIQQASGGQVEIEAIAPAWTSHGPGVRATDVLVHHPAVDRVRIHELELSPVVTTTWLAGEPVVDVMARSELGIVSGRLTIAEASGFLGQVKEVSLAQLPLRLEGTGIALAGQIDADAEISIDPRGILTGEVDLTGESIQIETEAFPMPIPFDEAKGTIEILANGTTRITGLDLTGSLFDGEISGEIGPDSRGGAPLELEARIVKISPMLRGLADSSGLGFFLEEGARFRVGGTLNEPRIETVYDPGGGRSE